VTYTAEETQTATRSNRSSPPSSVPTIVEALLCNARAMPGRPAMRYRKPTGGWARITWAEYARSVREVAQGLAALGLGPGARVGILSSNRPEWHLADLGIMANGGITVPLYPTSSVAQVAYALGHSRAEVCFVDGADQLAKVHQARAELPGLQRVIMTDNAWCEASSDDVLRFDDLRALGQDRMAARPDEGEARLAALKGGDLATIVYTSGTTGPPKGTMITHENILWTIHHVTPQYRLVPGERFLSFLPLSHIAERMMSDFTPIAIGGETWFARSLATVSEDLPSCRPTVFLAVPRVWEKLRQAIEDRVGSGPMGLRAAVSSYVFLGLRRVAAQQEGHGLIFPAELAYMAMDRTLGAGIRRQVGLDRAKVVVSAAAPVHPDLVRWFHAIGLPVMQIYGQTEGCGPTTAHKPDRIRIGTVGQPLPGMDVRLGEGQEILVRGGNVCLGYLDDPAATAELIDPEGWMHTGDTGVFDADGELRISGRKKDLIITAAGKNVAPQGIESDLGNEPLISEAVVAGEGRRYLVALITLDTDYLTAWARRHNKLEDQEALAGDPDVVAEVQAAVDRVNSRRSHAESIRKFRVLPRDLTADSGELTPTMKVKRSVVYDRYAAVIDEMYGGSADYRDASAPHRS
jgi:long-chain acyl-CoA synthetase